jgi:hypothetical protein
MRLSAADGAVRSHGFHAHGDRNDDRYRLASPTAPLIGDLDERTWPAVLAMVHVRERLDRLVVEDHHCR